MQTHLINISVKDDNPKKPSERPQNRQRSPIRYPSSSSRHQDDPGSNYSNPSDFRSDSNYNQYYDEEPGDARASLISDTRLSRIDDYHSVSPREYQRTYENATRFEEDLRGIQGSRLSSRESPMDPRLNRHQTGSYQHFDQYHEDSRPRSRLSDSRPVRSRSRSQSRRERSRGRDCYPEKRMRSRSRGYSRPSSRAESFGSRRTNSPHRNYDEVPKYRRSPSPRKHFNHSRYEPSENLQEDDYHWVYAQAKYRAYESIDGGRAQKEPQESRFNIASNHNREVQYEELHVPDSLKIPSWNYPPVREKLFEPEPRETFAHQNSLNAKRDNQISSKRQTSHFAEHEKAEHDLNQKRFSSEKQIPKPPPRRMSCYQPKRNAEETQERTHRDQSTNRRPQGIPQRRKSFYGGETNDKHNQDLRRPNQNQPKKAPPRRMSCYPSSTQASNGKTIENEVASRLKLSKETWKDEKSRTQASKSSLKDPRKKDSKMVEKTSSTAFHPEVTKPLEETRPQVVVDPVVAQASIRAFKIPKLKPTSSSDCEIVSDDAPKSAEKSVQEKVKSFTESILPEKVAKPEELVKDLEKVLGREMLLKLKNLLNQDQTSEDDTLPSGSTKIKRKRVLDSSSSESEEEVTSNKTSSSQIKPSKDEQNPKVKQFASKSTSKGAKRTAFSSKIEKNREISKNSSRTETSSKKEEAKTKDLAVKPTPMKEVLKKTPLKEAETKKIVEAKPTSSRETNKKTSQSSGTKQAGVVKKRPLTELDRLHNDINECFDSYSITHASGKRSCTKQAVRAKSVEIVSVEDLRKKFKLSRCEVSLKRLNMSGETMPIKIDRNFVLKNPDLEAELQSYLDMTEDAEDDKSSEQENPDSVQKTSINEPINKPSINERPKIAPIERKKIALDRTSLAKKLALRRKRANWSNGIILKKSRKQKVTVVEPTVDDEWEDLPDKKQEKSKDEKKVKLTDLVKFMSSFDKKTDKPVTESGQVVYFTVGETGNRITCELCSFESVEKKDFLSHVQTTHPLHVWNKYCQNCEKFIKDSGEDVESEFYHKLSHIEFADQSDDLVEEIPTKPVLPMLRFRALPGDKLSTFPKSSELPKLPKQVSPVKPAAAIKPQLNTSTEFLKVGEYTLKLSFPKELQKTYKGPAKDVHPSSSIHSPNNGNKQLVRVPLKLSPELGAKVNKLPSLVIRANNKEMTLSSNQLLSVPGNPQVSSPNIFKIKEPPKIKPCVIQTNAASVTTNTETESPFSNCDSDRIVSNKILRPWITSTSSFKIRSAVYMLKSHKYLAALFKCMGSTCSYFTSDKSLFTLHLQLHFLHQKNDKFYFLSCAYCENTASTVAGLISHIMSHHAYDKFQCAYCFYRAYSDFQVFHHHQIAYHKNKKKLLIECEVPAVKNQGSEIMRIKKNIPYFIPQVKCICE